MATVMQVASTAPPGEVVSGDSSANAPVRVRVDLEEYKKQLDVALKHNAAEYWASLKRFLIAKLTKGELDALVREWLGENLWLHNRFLQAILNNAHCTQPPKMPQRAATAPKKSSKKKKRTRTDSKKDSPLPKATIQELKKAALAPISAITKRAEPCGAGLPSLQRIARKPQRTLPVSSLDFELVGSPHLIAVRKKMLQIALSWGLADVGNGAVEYMMAALEYHLKDIIGLCNQTIPHMRRVSRDRRLKLQMGNTTALNGEQVLNVIEQRPRILSENLSLAREKLAIQDGTLSSEKVT